MSGATKKVPLSLVDIDEADIARVAGVVRSGWLTSGTFNLELEERFAAAMRVRNAVSMNSCASALHLALLALGVRGEVILPSFTFVATANAIVTAGATPVFAEIDPATRNLDPRAVEAAITPRTEAILPVHFAGQPCDMPALMAIARRHGLAVVEDSAQSIGAEVAGRKAGTFGVGCYSFYPTKNMTTGEGGMLVTDDDRLAETVRTYIGHGVLAFTRVAGNRARAADGRAGVCRGAPARPAGGGCRDPGRVGARGARLHGTARRLGRCGCWRPRSGSSPRCWCWPTAATPRACSWPPGTRWRGRRRGAPLGCWPPCSSPPRW